MPNGEYVSWEYMKAHEAKVVPLTERFLDVEAEVMGNEKSGRPSLRIELTNSIESQGKKTRTAIWTVGISFIITLVFGILSALTGFHFK